MKASTKLKILAAILSIVGITLIIIGFIDSDDIGPGIAFFPGAYITFISIVVWVSAFSPHIAKFKANLKSETLDVAGEEIGNVVDKTLDVTESGTKRVVKNIKEGLKDDVEIELKKIKKMFDEGTITEEEYQALRKKILGL